MRPIEENQGEMGTPSALAELVMCDPGWRDIWRGDQSSLMAEGLIPRGFAWPDESAQGMCKFEAGGLRVTVWCARRHPARRALVLDFSTWFVERQPVELRPGCGLLRAEEFACARRPAGPALDVEFYAAAVRRIRRDEGFRKFKRELLATARQRIRCGSK